MVTRFALLKELSTIITDDVIVLTSIGNNSGFWGQLKDREANLFHITMGMCSPTALGLSLALPNRKIVAIDSDGNMILNLGVLGTIANEAPKNLTIVLMDNQNYLGSHKHAPGMPTATAGKMNLEAVAKACGIDSACTVQDVNEFRSGFQAALSSIGPHFIRARVEPLDRDRPERSKRVPDPRENKYQFAGYIQRTEGVEILGSGLGGG
ncbi:MAG TPA: thiamine pyrophosphate-dependent enzyme [Candidatus Binatia bacterium]|jgi:Thiamine pyrophosphate-requiring enzymes [acetolactate synthase, pyruvate dehydrogenase (cytochrome), glyoxylate carboligase, phosphonopyruvate decarboxylase]